MRNLLLDKTEIWRQPIFPAHTADGYILTDFSVCKKAFTLFENKEKRKNQDDRN